MDKAEVARRQLGTALDMFLHEQMGDYRLDFAQISRKASKRSGDDIWRLLTRV